MSKFAKFTRRDGSPVYVAVTWVEAVRTPIPEVPKCKAELVLSGSVITVLETVEEVVELLEFEGGE